MVQANDLTAEIVVTVIPHVSLPAPSLPDMRLGSLHEIKTSTKGKAGESHKSIGAETINEDDK